MYHAHYKQKRRDKSVQSYPVDPHDLHRRLCVVLTQRKEQEALERRARETANRALQSSFVAYHADLDPRNSYHRPQSLHLDYMHYAAPLDYCGAPAAAPYMPIMATANNPTNQQEDGLVRRLSKRAKDSVRRRSSGADVLVTAMEEESSPKMGISKADHSLKTDRTPKASSSGTSPDPQAQRSDGGYSSEPTRANHDRTHNRASTCGPLYRADTATSVPLKKPSTSDGVLRVAPVAYDVGWAQDAALAPLESAPLKKGSSPWTRLSWGRSSRKRAKEEGSKSPLTSLFARFRR